MSDRVRMLAYAEDGEVATVVSGPDGNPSYAPATPLWLPWAPTPLLVITLISITIEEAGFSLIQIMNATADQSPPEWVSNLTDYPYAISFFLASLLGAFSLFWVLVNINRGEYGRRRCGLAAVLALAFSWCGIVVLAPAVMILYGLVLVLGWKFESWAQSRAKRRKVSGNVLQNAAVSSLGLGDSGGFRLKPVTRPAHTVRALIVLLALAATVFFLQLFYGITGNVWLGVVMWFPFILALLASLSSVMWLLDNANRVKSGHIFCLVVSVVGIVCSSLGVVIFPSFVVSLWIPDPW